MDRITIIIETANNAFKEVDSENYNTSNTEVIRILKELICNLEGGNIPEKLRDINGNTCGSITIE